MGTAPLPVVADVDTGIDDALALLYLAAHPGIDLRAVSCVAGNIDVDRVVRNTLDVLATAGASNVPVARGAQRPLVNRALDAASVHGSNGLGGLDLDRSTATPYDGVGIELLRDAVEASSEPVTLLALGPLTNVALFLRAFPAHASRLDRIVFMGGSAGIGNASAVAEFNAWHDPEAVAVVVDSGVPVTMYGLDVFYRPTVAPTTITALSGSGSAPARLAGRLLDFAAARNLAETGAVGATIGDAGAACVLTRPDLMTKSEHGVLVELGGHSRGQTIVDRRPGRGESEVHGVATQPARVTVVTDLDGPAVVQTWLDTVDAS